MNKLSTIVLSILIPIFLFGATNVTPKVEYTKGFIENIRSNDTLVNGSGQPYSSGGAASWGAISGTLSSQTDLNTQLTNRYTISQLASTNLGSEGTGLIGAQGGYNLKRFFQDTQVRGISRDYPIFTYSQSPASNLVVSWTDGDIYDPTRGYYHLIPGTNTLVNNALNIAYFDINNPNVIQWTSGTRPETLTSVVIASFTAIAGMIIQANPEGSAGDNVLETEDASFNMFPSIISIGCGVFAGGTGLTNIQANSGVEFYEQSTKIIHPAFNLSNPGSLLYVYSHQGGVTNWTFFTTNKFPVGLWDNGSNIVSMTATNWYRGVYLNPPSSNQLYYILPQVSYTDSVTATASGDPSLPPGMSTYIPLVTAYIYQGSDTTVRTASNYWLDRRMNPNNLRPNSTVISGGSTPTPSLNQVLIVGNGTGGILPNGMGFPTTSDQAASKGYVDSSVNNINSGRAYVDPKGNDVTAVLNNSILPYQHIQSAINAIVLAGVATSTSRYVVTVSPGIYNENLIMKNFISVRGTAVEETILNGFITYPPAYNDIVMAEIGQVTVMSSNSPTVFFDGGTDQAAMALRSCILVPQYYSNYTNHYMSVVTVNRGIVNLFPGVSYEFINNGTTNLNSYETVIEHTDDPSNIGLSTLTANGISGFFITVNPNDEISELLTHDNSDSQCINTIQASSFNIYLNSPSVTYSNNIKLVSQVRAIGRCLLMGDLTRLWMNTTNGNNIFMGYADHGTGDNVSIIRNNHLRISSGSTSNIWYGAAVTTNDSLRIIDSEIIQANAFDYYPQRYTAAGSDGHYYINTTHQNGDQLFGSAVDMSTVNSVNIPVLPTSGHVKLYCYNYAGLESFYFIDSSGNITRVGRDSNFNAMNSESTTLRVGECVWITNGLSYGQTPIIARCDAANINTLPCDGVVIQVGGITNNGIGRIMSIGRNESFFDTSMFNSGDRLYVPVLQNGSSMVTNVAPSGTNFVEQVGKVHLSSTNGHLSVHVFHQDSLGGQVPSYYVSVSQLNSTNNLNITFTTNLVSITSNSLQASINIAMTNYIGALNSYSNALNTAMTSTVVNATNALWIAVTNLNAANIAINNVVLDVTRGNTNLYILVTNAQTTANIALTNYLATLNSYSNALNNQIINSTNALWIAVTNLNAANITINNLVLDSTRGNSNLYTLVNIANTNYQGPLTSVSSASTNYANSIAVSATNYTGSISNNLYTAMTNLVTGTSNSLQSGINIAMTNYVASDNISRTNYQGPLTSASSASTNYANSIAVSATNYTGSISNNLYITMTNNDTSILSIANSATNWISSNSNKVNAAITNNQTGVTINGVTLVPPIRFKANIGNANISLSSSGNPSLLNMTNTVLASTGGSIYSNTVAQWWPKATNGIVTLRGGFSCTVASNIRINLDIHKNGSLLTTVIDHDFSTGAGNQNDTYTWGYVDTTTPTTNDYYELFYTVGNTRTTVGAGTNNWWYGSVEQ